MKWIKITFLKVADLQSKILLVFIFFILLPFFAWITLIKRNKKLKSYWYSWDLPSDSIEKLKKQY